MIEEERNMTYDDDIVRSSRNITPSEQPNQPDMLSEINTNDGTFEIYQRRRTHHQSLPTTAKPQMTTEIKLEG